MASSTFNKRDLNRFRKVYPFRRKRERLSIVPDPESFNVEIGTADFVSANSVTVTFTANFTSVPVVTVTPLDSSSNEDANVNLFVTSVTLTSFTVEASSAFTGTVNYHAIQVQ